MELLKKIKPIEIIVLAGIILALGVGFATFKNYRQTASKQIEATSKISFQVFLRGISYTGQQMPIRSGEKTFISIRNVPYSDLDIVDVKIEKKKVLLPSLNSKNPIVVDDVTMANTYDVIVTLVDTAKITKDGAVVGGNKIKIGLPITLEGKDYRFNGTVSDLKTIPGIDEKQVINNELNTTDDVQ